MYTERLQEIPSGEVLDSAEFDLSTFFNDTETSTVQSKQLSESVPDLLVTLRNEANESITTITTKVTAETFANGVALTGSVFAALGSVIGSCGIICAHTLGNIGSGISGASGLGGLEMPHMSRDHQGNYHLDGELNSISRMSGVSPSDLLRGRFTSSDIVAMFSSLLGEGVCVTFGFGLIEMCMDAAFDSFLPHSS